MSDGASEPIVVCQACGAEIHLGDWPFCPHGRTTPYHPFIPYFDTGLGAQVNSLAERWRLMKQHHADYRDHPTAGDISARRDWCEEQKRARRA